MMVQFFLFSIIKLFVKDFEGFDKFILVAEPVEFHSAGSSAPFISAISIYDIVDEGISIFDGFDQNASFEEVSEEASGEVSEEVSENSSEFEFIEFSDIMAKSSKAGFDDHTVVPERGVPQFDGTLSRWKECEKRATMFIAKLIFGEEGGRSGS